MAADIKVIIDPVFIAAAKRRLQTLSARGLQRFFGARMQYSFPLAGGSAISDPENFLSGPIEADTPWPIEFWFGRWVADCLSGLLAGSFRPHFTGQEIPNPRPRP